MRAKNQREKRPESISWVPHASGVGLGSAEGMLWPALGLAEPCRGKESQGEDLNLPVGRQRVKIFEDAAPHRSWGGHQCKQTLCISSQGFRDSRQGSSSCRLHNPALNDLSTQ